MMTTKPTVRIGYERKDAHDELLNREWLVTNGLGGYASGSVGGALTRRFHGLLIAALPAPLGRTMMFNQAREELRFSDGRALCLSGQEPLNGELAVPHLLERFYLEDGLPVWVYASDEVVIEKRLFMPHLSNTTVVLYRLVRAPHQLVLRLALGFNVRRHEGSLGARIEVDQHGQVQFPYELSEFQSGLELRAGEPYPALHLLTPGQQTRFVHETSVTELVYRVERSRGYDFHGPVFTPGYLALELEPEASASLIATTEPRSALGEANPEALLHKERERRQHLLETSHPALQSGLGAELVMAADQFVINPPKRSADAKHRDLRSVIAGYHWFTDWGRDTMISLEGLTLLTGRHAAARDILLTFAQHTRHGLIPNLFPEGGLEGLYHTADATLWFFHALDRYVTLTSDDATRRALMPTLRSILDAHFAGTDFGIGVDPEDGLLRQGADGYQLTWMDAKVDGWVVTPRRGKAVEINALFYNALCLAERWFAEDGDTDQAQKLRRSAERARRSFNQRFWYEQGGHLYDVIDGPDDANAGPNDPAFRPNQLFAISLPHPVLDEARWKPVVELAHERLLTPAGLRSLAPGHPDYKARYDGDLRARDAAYHQGTVWGWLIGPFFDAWRKVYPADRHGAHDLLTRFDAQLDEACIGSISEIFDAEAPYASRGCIAQAWSIAEVLRCLVKSETDRR